MPRILKPTHAGKTLSIHRVDRPQTPVSKGPVARGSEQGWVPRGRAGLPEHDLETKPRSPSAVDKRELYERISSLSIDGGAEGVTKTLSMAKVPRDLQAPINDALEAVKRKARKKDRAAEFGDVTIKAVHEPDKNGRAGVLVGYTVDLGISSEEHNVDRRLTFSRGGLVVCDEYIGE